MMRIISPIISENRITTFSLMMDPPYTTKRYPGIVNNIFGLFSDMYSHNCINERKLDIYEELNDSMVPHLLEHTILELHRPIMHYVGAMSGLTTWDFKEYGIGVFKISFDVIYEEFSPMAVYGGILILESLVGGGCQDHARLIIENISKIAVSIDKQHQI